MNRHVPNRFLLTLRLGEVPEHVPGLIAVRTYGTAPAETVDGGVIDRLLRHHGGAVRITRLHSARVRRAERAVAGARRFDDVEQLSGVARVLRVEIRDRAGLPALLRALAELPTVERVGADYLSGSAGGGAAGAVGRADWAHDAIRLPQALAYEPGDPAVVVGLADTGVALAHEELRARLRAGFDTVDLDPSAVGDLQLVGDYRRAGERANDEVGHGTGCAGILVARGRAMAPGGAGLCGLTPVRVLGAAMGANQKRFGVGALDNIDAGMKRLVDLGVKVINMSFGTPESALLADAPRPHEEIVRYALARGVILVAASGNSGLTERYYPAAHDGVIAVGAVDHRLQLAGFSTRGDHVAVSAPGTGISTCALDGYQSANGTSFAAPFVAGACALLVARAQRRAWPLDGADAREILLATAKPFGTAGVQGGGAGVLDVRAALGALDARIDAAFEREAGDPPDGAAPGVPSGIALRPTDPSAADRAA